MMMYGVKGFSGSGNYGSAIGFSSLGILLFSVHTGVLDFLKLC